MRIIINGSGLSVLLVIMSIIHCVIITDNYWQLKLDRQLSDGLEYCIDTAVDEADFTERLGACMRDRDNGSCESYIYIPVLDMDRGYVHIVAEKRFNYGFLGLRGRCSYERAYQWK